MYYNKEFELGLNDYNSTFFDSVKLCTCDLFWEVY